MIARGTRVDLDGDGRRDVCDVDFGIQTPNFSSGEYRVDLRADEDCVITVHQLDDRTTSALQAKVSEAPSFLARLVSGIGDWIAPRVSAASGPKRTTNYVWMYGYGGTWDMLSEVRGFVDWSWDSTSAWTNASYSYCEAHNSTLWWMNGCWIRYQQYNGGWVEQLTEGNFFWAPYGVGNTHYYVHQLLNDRQGDQYGNGSCSGWYTGSIVAGAAMKCEVVQPPPCGVANICFSTAPH